MASVDDACFEPGAGINSLLGLRIGGLFGILVASAVGIAIPFLAAVEKRGSLFFLLRAFAGGVVLATGYVHILGDAYPILLNPCLGLSTEYPWALAIATAASLMTFNLEWIFHKVFTHRLSKPCDCCPGGALGPVNGEPGALKDAETGSSRDLSIQGKTELKRLQNAVRSYTFETGIIFHSVFVGVTLGVSQNTGTVTALVIALIFHQGNEGLALGVLFVKAGLSRMRYALMALAFVFVTPLGVAIGIAVSSGYNGASKGALGTEGAFDAVSAGILIYNGLVDLVLPTFDPDEVPKAWWLQALGFIFLYLGAAIMALIGKWA